MYQNEPDMIRIAILDLYNGETNEGIRCIQDIIQDFALDSEQEIIVDKFEIRYKEEVPDLSYDIYISSGGPGSPLETIGMSWDNKYLDFIDSLEAWNLLPGTKKKYVFFICHSFQMICRHYDFAEISQRSVSSYGIFPIHLNQAGRQEAIFETLPEPFYIADFRMFQVIRPDLKKMEAKGYTILAEESQLATGTYDRALMAIRFSEYFFATQFHPEADPGGMLIHFNGAKKEPIIKNLGQKALDDMICHLKDPEKIEKTRHTILPKFLRLAAGQLELVEIKN